MLQGDQATWLPGYLTNRQTDEQTSRRADTQTRRRADTQTSRRADKQMSRRLHEPRSQMKTTVTPTTHLHMHASPQTHCPQQFIHIHTRHHRSTDNPPHRSGNGIDDDDDERRTNNEQRTNERTNNERTTNERTINERTINVRCPRRRRYSIIQCTSLPCPHIGLHSPLVFGCFPSQSH